MTQSGKPRIEQYSEMLKVLAKFDAEESFQRLLALNAEVLRAVFANAGYSREKFSDISVQGARDNYIALSQEDEQILDGLYKSWLQVRLTTINPGETPTIKTSILEYPAGTTVEEIHKGLEAAHPDFSIEQLEKRLLTGKVKATASRFGDGKRIDGSPKGIKGLLTKSITATVIFDPISGVAWLEDTHQIDPAKLKAALNDLKFEVGGKGYQLESIDTGWQVIPEALAKAKNPANGSAPIVTRDPVVGLFMWSKPDRSLVAEERFSSSKDAFLDFYTRHVVK